MSARKHRVAAAVCLLLAAFAILGLILEGGRLDWDLNAVSDATRRNSPLWFVIITASGFALVMGVAAVWQLRLAARKQR